jgi:alanine racemase
VLPDKQPVYVRLEPTDLPRISQLVRTRIPPQAGILVPATDLGFAALAEVRRTGKRSLAVWARTPMDWFLAGSAGAEVVIAEDLAAASRIIDVARGHLPWLVARVDTAGQVLDALRMGLAGSLVPPDVFRRIHDAELASPAGSAIPTPSTGEGDRVPACGCARCAMRQEQGAHSACRPNVVEIDLSAIAHNVREVRRVVGPEIRILPALKANAYGFGLSEVARVVIEAGADGVNVADACDGVQLRRDGVQQQILLYAGSAPADSTLAAAEKSRLIVTVDSLTTANRLIKSRRRLDVFVEIDVGLDRLGAPPEDAMAVMEAVERAPNLTLAGVYAHPHVVRTADAPEYLASQYTTFSDIVGRAEARGYQIKTKMFASSAVLAATRQMFLNAVDPGHLIFGLVPPGPKKVDLTLRSPLRKLFSQLIAVRSVRRNSFEHLAPFPPSTKRFGVIPIGIADGVKSLNCGYVLVRGSRVPLLGYPGLEHSRADLTHLPDASVGDEVVFVGQQGREAIRIEEVVASVSSEVPAEVPLAIRETIHRRYLGGR